MPDVRYADSLGFLAALNPGAVRFYDTYLFPLSRMLDACLGPVIGKNLILRATKT